MPTHPARGHVLCYECAMRRPDAKQTSGIIHLRIGYSAKLRYAGHIGYKVESSNAGTATSPTALRRYG